MSQDARPKSQPLDFCPVLRQKLASLEGNRSNKERQERSKLLGTDGTHLRQVGMSKWQKFRS
jgi:hypothetical protein